ncbi:hypothetical protein Tco_0158833, partial [Tanacetum coccineum]
MKGGMGAGNKRVSSAKEQEVTINVKEILSGDATSIVSSNEPRTKAAFSDVCGQSDR